MKTLRVLVLLVIVKCAIGCTPDPIKNEEPKIYKSELCCGEVGQIPDEPNQEDDDD